MGSGESNRLSFGPPKERPPGTGGKVDIVVKSLIVELPRRDTGPRNQTLGSPRGPSRIWKKS